MARRSRLDAELVRRGLARSPEHAVALLAEGRVPVSGPAATHLSFISLRLVLPALTGCATPVADLLPMVKPQFEVGRERLGAGGVVRDPAHRADAVATVAAAAADLGWGTAGVVASPLPGPA